MRHDETASERNRGGTATLEGQNSADLAEDETETEERTRGVAERKGEDEQRRKKMKGTSSGKLPWGGLERLARALATHLAPRFVSSHAFRGTIYIL